MRADFFGVIMGAMLAGCGASPVKSITIPTTPKAAEAPRAKDAPRPDPEVYFAGLRDELAKRSAHELSFGTDDFESGTRTTVYLDKELRVVVVEDKWSSEGSSGDSSYLVQDGVV